MTRHLDEAGARAALARVGSAAQDPAHYAAHRYADGWVFSWGADLDTTPIGSAPWVVTDTGRVSRVPIGRDAVDYLDQMAAGDAG